MRKLIAVTSTLALSVLLIGCETVQPWQKGNLAKPDMASAPIRCKRALKNTRTSAMKAHRAE